MENNHPQSPSSEEQLLRQMRIALLGRDAQGRCGPLSKGQQGQVDEAAITMIMETMQVGREKAMEIFQKMKS